MKQLEKARKYEELYKELFDRNSKVTTICLLLCGAFWVLKLYVLSEQCLILFFFSGGLYGLRRIHREHVQLGEYYLPDQLRTSSICNKVLYKGNVIPVRIISGNPRQFNYRDESAGVCVSAQKI